VKPFGHPLRVRIYHFIDEEGEASPTGIARALGSKVETVAYHVRVMVDAGVLYRARQKPVRGSIEHYYRLATDGPAGPARTPEMFVCHETSAVELEATLIELLVAATTGIRGEDRVRITCLVERL
jgi:DNA-binding transcriptional ArsR family regulator